MKCGLYKLSLMPIIVCTVHYIQSSSLQSAFYQKYCNIVMGSDGLL